MSADVTHDRAESLREWSCGMYTLEAAAELLIRAHDGRLLGGPWIAWDDARHRYWFDPEVAVAEGGYLSGGEHRLLMLAVALCGEHPIDLGDVASGIDRDALAVVLAAIAHAGGSHDHSRMLWEDGEDGTRVYVGSERLGSLYPWPEPGEDDGDIEDDGEEPL